MPVLELPRDRKKWTHRPFAHAEAPRAVRLGPPTAMAARRTFAEKRAEDANDGVALAAAVAPVSSGGQDILKVLLQPYDGAAIIPEIDAAYLTHRFESDLGIGFDDADHLSASSADAYEATSSTVSVYIGGNLGYGWGNGNTDFSFLPIPESFELNNGSLGIRSTGVIGGA